MSIDLFMATVAAVASGVLLGGSFWLAIFISRKEERETGETSLMTLLGLIGPLALILLIVFGFVLVEN